MSIHQTKNPGLEKESRQKKQKKLPKEKESPSTVSLPTDSQLVSFGDRITYTFAHGKEIGSIHFDRGRGEIFYKGHNIRNMDPEEWQWQMMEKLRQVLLSDEKGKQFAEAYGRILDKIILEKKNATPQHFIP